jgi:BirA family biotin operon repressor/biotin-[acetyl-CoA-carboxylase] ligase
VEPVTRIDHVELQVVDSTQDEVRRRLEQASAGAVIAVSARAQHAGRGREGRVWQDPPGEALLLSIGARGPLPVRLLHELPRRVIDALLDALEAQLDEPDAVRGVLAWKSPNDLVAATSGAKVAGVIIDARTVADRVEQVVAGVGCNLDGAPFTTLDSRAATSVGALLADARIDRGLLASDLAERVAELLAPAT